MEVAVARDEAMEVRIGLGMSASIYASIFISLVWRIANEIL
jgi:hypothetical protein